MQELRSGMKPTAGRWLTAACMLQRLRRVPGSPCRRASGSARSTALQSQAAMASTLPTTARFMAHPSAWIAGRRWWISSPRTHIASEVPHPAAALGSELGAARKACNDQTSSWIVMRTLHVAGSLLLQHTMCADHTYNKYCSGPFLHTCDGVGSLMHTSGSYVFFWCMSLPSLVACDATMRGHKARPPSVWSACMGPAVSVIADLR